MLNNIDSQIEKILLNCNETDSEVCDKCTLFDACYEYYTGGE